MSQFYDQASLVMVPSGYKNGKVYSQKPLSTDGELTFTRASNATRVGPDGLIHKVRKNLFTYSQQLDNAAWTKAVTTITANAIVAPDGTTTADKMADSDTTTAARYTYQAPASSGTIYTSSGYFKKGEYNFVTLHAFGINGAVFNLDTGVKVSQSGGVGSIESVGNGFYRCSFAFTAGGTSVFFSQSPAGNITYAGTTGSGIYAWGLQVETGDIATDYIPTTTAAVSVGPVSGLPRLDYSGGATCPSLKLEPQRTNLALFSESFDNAAWIKFGSTSVTANTAVSPDGYTNADTVSTSGGAVVRQVLTLSASTVYTYSIFVKKTNYDLFGFQTLINGAGVKSVFNLNTGVVTTQGSGHTASIVNYGNGFYRCIVTFNCGSSTSNIFDLATDGSASTLREYYCYGAMAELGAYASSYIPTLSTSVTRVADAASKTGISSLIGQTEGTMFVDISGESLQNNSRYMSISDFNDPNKRITIYQESGIINVYCSAGSSFNLGYNPPAGRLKIAFGYKSGQYVLYVNGVNAISSNEAVVQGYSDLGLGVNEYLGTANPPAVGYNQVLLFKTRLSNADLARLTSL